MYENELAWRSTTSTFHNFLLFLLALVQKDENKDRASLEKKLHKLAQLAYQICTPEPSPRVRESRSEWKVEVNDGNVNIHALREHLQS
jgi:hypothetical protein